MAERQPGLSAYSGVKFASDHAIKAADADRQLDAEQGSRRLLEALATYAARHHAHRGIPPA